MGRRFRRDFHGLTHYRRTGHFSREKREYRFPRVVQQRSLRARYKLPGFWLVRRLGQISDHWISFVRTFGQFTMSPLVKKLLTGLKSKQVLTRNMSSLHECFALAIHYL